MRTAIDSSALLAVFGDEPDGPAWLDALMQARREGHLSSHGILVVRGCTLARQGSGKLAVGRLSAAMTTQGSR